MDSLSIWHILILLIFGFVFVIGPVLWVLISKRSSGGAKFGWFIITLFFSWLGLAAFLIFTQPPQHSRGS